MSWLCVIVLSNFEVWPNLHCIFNMFLQVFNGIQIRKLSWPNHKGDPNLCKPKFGSLICMFGIIVLLEDLLKWFSFFCIGEHNLDHYFHVAKLIHRTWYSMYRPCTFVWRNMILAPPCLTILTIFFGLYAIPAVFLQTYNDQLNQKKINLPSFVHKIFLHLSIVQFTYI